MAKYKVKNTSILHNGKVYAEGSTLELSENQAKRLEDFVDLVPETATKTPSQTKPQTNKTKSETKKVTPPIGSVTHLSVYVTDKSLSLHQ